MKHIASRRARKRGFTLIELLVVVIIIGILAAIAVPIFLNQRKAAWKASAESDVSNATLAIETARTQTGTLDGVVFSGGVDGQPLLITMGTPAAPAPAPSDPAPAPAGSIRAEDFTMHVGDPAPTASDFHASATSADGSPAEVSVSLGGIDLTSPGAYRVTITASDRQTMVVRLTILPASTPAGDSIKSPVSPGNTETAWVGKDGKGQECYAVMTTNRSVPDWAAVRTSEGRMTTGTPPAEGSTACPKPAA